MITADLKPYLHRESSLAVPRMSGEHAKRPRCQHHLAFPLQEARLPERQRRWLGQLTEPVEPINWPRQGALCNQIPERLRAIGPKHVVGVLHAFRPFHKVEPCRAEQ